METKEENKIHLKIDDIVLSLLSDYHNIKPIDAIAFFHDMARQAASGDGNIVNKDKKMVKGYSRKTRSVIWRTVKQPPKTVDTSLSPWRRIEQPDYDAYSLRGFYPDTKIPFKMSGVKNGDFACFVIAMGNKAKQTKVNVKALAELDEVMAEAILLDKNPEEISPDFYKIKKFKLQRPKGLPLLKKAKNVKKKDNK